MDRNEETVDWRKLVGYDEFLGQQRQLRQMGKFPAVSMLVGQRGTGKTLVMRAVLAQWVCQERTGCGDCSPCRQVLLGTHPDVLILEPAKGTYKVDHAEKVREHLEVQPLGSHRVVGIPNAEGFLVHGVNRLLKTLEEPPEHAAVVLTTSRWHSLIPTLKSRCVQRRLPRLEAPHCWQVVRELAAEAAELTEEQGLKLCERHHNSPGVVLEALQQGDESELPKFTRELLTSSSPAQVSAVAEKIASIADAAQLTSEVEIVLKELYLEGHHETLRKMAIRRNILNKTRTIAVRSRIAINTRLVAEGLGFADESWLNRFNT